MCEPMPEPTCKGCGEIMLGASCGSCGQKWRGSRCEGCGRPLVQRPGRGRPRVFCPPLPGRRWSRCGGEEAKACYLRLMRLLEEMRANGLEARFADPTWLLIVSNQTRDYSRQPRIPAGEDGAGRYKPRNGYNAPVAGFLPAPALEEDQGEEKSA